MRVWLSVCMVLIASAAAQAQTISGDVFRLNTGPCSIRSGSGAPAGSLGTVCNVYVRTDNYIIYVKTGASTWTPVLQMPSGAAAGDLITAASTTLSGRIAAVASGQVLASAGTGTAPAYTASPSLTSIGGAANLTLNPTDDLILNPTGNDVLPTSNYDINLGSLATKFRELHAAELWVETLVAQNTIATIGGRVLVMPTTTLTSDVSTVATTISVAHNQMANGDHVILQANGREERMQIASSPSGTGPYTYTVTRDTDGTGANAWVAGDAVANTGTTGNGFIDVHSLWSVNQPQFSYVVNYDAAGNAYSANYAESGTWSPFGDSANDGVNDAIYFGRTGGTFPAISQWCSTGLAPSTATFVWEYWNGSAWTSVTMSGTLAAVGRNTSTVGTTTGWATTAVNGLTAYWLRIRLTNTPAPAMTPASCYLPAREPRMWGPAITFNVRTGTGYNALGVRGSLGNLNGVYDYTTDTYGAGFGDPSGTHITADASNGFRIRYGTSTKLSADTSGNLTLAGDLSVGSTATFRSGTTTYASGTGYVFDYSGSVYRFRVGTTTGNRFAWDGTNLTLVSANATIDSNGVTIAANTANANWNALNSFAFSGMTSTTAGVGAIALGTTNRAIKSDIVYSGSTASMITENRILAQHSGSGTGAYSMVRAVVTGNGGISDAGINLETTGGGVLGYGLITFTGYPNFTNDGTTNAGAGAQTLPSNPCGFIVASYQGDTTNQIRIPFYAANGGSCPTVP